MRRVPFSFVIVTLINLIVPNSHINGVWGAEVANVQVQPPPDSPSGYLQKIQADSEKLLDVSALVKDVNAAPDVNVVAPPLVGRVNKREHPFHLLFNRNLNTREVKNSPGAPSSVDLSRNVFGDIFSFLGLGGSSEVNTTAASPNKEASGSIPEVPPVESPPKLDVAPVSELEQPAPPPASAEESTPEEPPKKVKREENLVISNVEGNATSVPIPAPPLLSPLDGVVEIFIFTITPSNTTHLNVTEPVDAKPLLTK